MNDGSDRTWGMLCHLSALSIYVGVPFGNLIGPLVIWLMKRDESPFVSDQGRESLNFQISMTIYMVISAILAIVLVGCFLLVILTILDIVFVVMAAIAANDGRFYRYPLTIRFL